MYVKINKIQGIELNGAVMSGNTYPVKDYIKAYLGGRYDGQSKSWTVDTGKVARLLDAAGSSFRTDDNPPAPKSKVAGLGGWCPKCHDWTYGDCGH